MERFGDLYLDLNQNEANLEDINLNAVLVELDKGLLSDNIGQQVESIVKFSELFDKFPLPVFVNSGFSRLGKVFQNGNNYLKLQVIRVIEKNQKHLAKILNVDDLTNLLFYNIHSNDAICRALTLRALAEISAIISDKHNVQHSIRLALESHDEAEAREAIYAANKFCALSTSFAASLFDRITEMIEDIQSPLDRKMKLVPLLVHMHHDTALSAKAKNLCQSMYFSFPRGDISKIILNTLTQIACKSLTNVDETITFFIKLLHEEPRQRIQLYLLRNLALLANRAAHLWSNANVTSFIEYTNAQMSNAVQFLLKASQILCTLANNSNIYFLFSFGVVDSNKLDEVSLDESLKIDSQLLERLIEAMLFHENKQLAYNFCLLSTTLLVLHSKSSSVDELAAASKSVYIKNLSDLTKSGLFAIILDCDKVIESLRPEQTEYESKLELYTKYLKNSLVCTIRLVKMNNQAYFDELYSFVGSLFRRLGQHRAVLYCETLLTLTRYQNVTNVHVNPFYCEREQLALVAQTFTKLMEQRVDDEAVGTDAVAELQLKCLNLVFELQIRRVDFLESEGAPDEDILPIREWVRRLLESRLSSGHKIWSVFQLARMCVRYVHYDLAHEIYTRLSTRLVADPLTASNMSTSDLSYKCWFDFMAFACRAEHLLSSQSTKGATVNDLIASLNDALSNYMRAQVIFKSSCVRSLTPPSTMSMMPVLESSSTCFQIRYCELRCEQIRLFVHLILSTMTCFTQPAPVFKFQSSENFARFGRVAQQLKYSVAELHKLTQKYKDFIAECFDADQHTLNVLNICKKQNECLINCLNLLISPKNEQQVRDEFYANFLNVKPSQANDNRQAEFVEYFAELKLVENFYLNLLDKLRPLFNQDKENNGTSISHFQRILVDFIALPIPLPRAFFTTLQKTQIKLIVNPNNKKTNSIPTVRCDQTLVVKIDGIINQQFKTKEPIRTVKKVQVSLSVELDSKSIPEARTIKYSDVRTSLEEPKNDYFNSNILINFPYFGTYNIQVDLYLLDNSDVIWRYISEKHQIAVKVEEDPNRQRLFAALFAPAAASSVPPSTSAASQAFVDGNIERMT